MPLDHTVYPDDHYSPGKVMTSEAKAEYLHRICAAFDFGIVPEPADWEHFRGWKSVFDAYPLPHSPASHTFRSRYGWEPVPRGTCGLVPAWRVQDQREGHTDPCENSV